MKQLALAAVGLAVLAGCGNASFNETDNGRAVEVAQGTRFTLTLPDSSQGAPAIAGAILELVRDSRDPSAHRRVFEFAARASGESEIRIPPDYVLRVIVRSSYEEPKMRPPSH